MPALGRVGGPGLPVPHTSHVTAAWCSTHGHTTAKVAGEGGGDRPTERARYLATPKHSGKTCSRMWLTLTQPTRTHPHMPQRWYPRQQHTLSLSKVQAAHDHGSLDAGWNALGSSSLLSLSEMTMTWGSAHWRLAASPGSEGRRSPLSGPCSSRGCRLSSPQHSTSSSRSSSARTAQSSSSSSSGGAGLTGRARFNLPGPSDMPAWTRKG